MTDQTFAGECACGHVRYEMTSAPMFVHCCHCRSCQRENGSAFAVNALIEADRVVLRAGKTVEVTVPSDSGTGQKIHRCPKCNVAVWSHYALSGGIGDKVRFIRVGTLDSADEVTPDIHIYTKSKLPWVVLPPGATAVEEYYSAKEIWPADSLARRAALFESQ
jgi:hypothetical protein